MSKNKKQKPTGQSTSGSSYIYASLETDGAKSSIVPKATTHK